MANSYFTVSASVEFLRIEVDSGQTKVGFLDFWPGQMTSTDKLAFGLANSQRLKAGSSYPKDRMLERVKALPNIYVVLLNGN